ncbi:hypothetical protein ACHQM5_017566 [Ranunculus cassubicifolius]
MAASAGIRSAFRSTAASFRATAAQAKRRPTSSPFQLPKQNPLSSRILLRSPVELSCCVDSLMPYHTATSSALLTSMISISRRSCWFPEGCCDDS